MFIDVSLPIKEGMRTWPREDWVTSELMTDFEKKGVRVSRLTLGSHTGTHIDAPRHFLKDGYGVDQIPLEKLVGLCSVIEIEPKDRKGITAEDIEAWEVGKHALERRILFKTRNSVHLTDTTFYDTYVYLTESGAKYLLDKGVELIGIDYLSIEKRGSLGHPAHTLLLEEGVVIVEGVNLVSIEPGTYTIIALPLRLEGLDGSPARVVLMQ